MVERRRCGIGGMVGHGLNGGVTVPKLCVAQDPQADQLLSENSFALLTGMLLDQQV